MNDNFIKNLYLNEYKKFYLGGEELTIKDMIYNGYFESYDEKTTELINKKKFKSYLFRY